MIMVFFLVLLVGYMLYLAFQVNVKEHTMPIREMKEGERFHLFFISDIHRRKISDQLIHSLMGKADIVVIGGDLTEKGVPFSRIEQNIKQLCKLGNVYFVYGNNDREVEEQTFRSILEENGVVLLKNDSVLLPKTNQSIRIVGIDDGFTGKVRIYDAFRDVKDDEIVIFVSHAPAFFSNAKKVAKPHLLLAGHLHGGQIRFGRFGLYENGSFQIKENSAELISNGFGTTGVPLRLGAKSECHIITLYGEVRKK